MRRSLPTPSLDFARNPLVSISCDWLLTCIYLDVIQNRATLLHGSWLEVNMSSWYFPFQITGAEPWAWSALCLVAIVFLLMPKRKPAKRPLNRSRRNPESAKSPIQRFDVE